MAQPDTDYKIWTTNKITLEGRGLEQASTNIFLPATQEAQHRDSEHADMSNGNHISIAIQLYVAIVILCLFCDFDTMLCHAAKSKTYLESNIFK